MRLVGLQELASLFPKYCVTPKKKGAPPMSFYQQLPTFQVETKTGSTMFPSQNEANVLYQKYVKDQTPCEFWRDGEKQKEFKP